MTRYIACYFEHWLEILTCMVGPQESTKGLIILNKLADNGNDSVVEVHTYTEMTLFYDRIYKNGLVLKIHTYAKKMTKCWRFTLMQRAPTRITKCLRILNTLIVLKEMISVQFALVH